MSSTNSSFVGNRFRIVAKICSGKICLVSLFPTAKAARMRIEQFSEAPTDCRKNQLKALWIEEWIGEPTNGYWRRLLLRNGGTYFKVMVSEERKFQITAGGIVDAVLLEQKTRRGGWNAALEVDPSIQGPITKMSEWPTDWKPSLKVKLQLCSLSKSSSRAQFAMVNN